MDRQRDAKIDPRLAEEFADRQERGNVRNQEILARQGDIAERGSLRMGNILSNGIKEGHQAYRQGRADKTDEKFNKIKYDRQRAEDEYWNGPWDGASTGGVSSGGGASGGLGSAGDNRGLAPGSGSDVNGNLVPGTIRQGVAEDDAPTVRTVKPPQSFSPGAVAVLEGRAKPGFNPADRRLENPTTRYLGGETSTADYLGLNRMPPPEARGQTFAPPTNSSQGTAPIGLGSGFGTSSQGNAGQNVPRETSGGIRVAGDPNKTRLQHKWDLGLMKSEEELNQLRKGKNTNSRQNPWQNTGKFDAAGHPIKFNAQTGEYGIDEGVTGQAPVDKTAATEYQRGQLELGKERNKIAADAAKNKGKTAGGAKVITPYQQAQLDHQKKADDARAEDKIDTRVTKYSTNMEPTVKAIGQLESIHKIIDKKEDIPGVGMTAAAPNWLTSRDGQDVRQKVKTLFNIELKDRSGAAVVDQELDRLKEEFGQGAWSTDRQLREGIRAYEARLHEVIRNMNAGVDPAVIGEYAGRGGRDTRSFTPPPEDKWIGGKRYIRGKNPEGKEGWVPAK